MLQQTQQPNGGGGDPQAANMQARSLILANAVDMWLPIAAGTIAGGGTQTNVAPRNVGLIKRFVIEITGTFTTSGAAGDNVVLTNLGLANVLSNVTFTDLSNQTRINTYGWHLMALATARRQAVFGAAFTSDNAMGYGVNYAAAAGAGAIAGVNSTAATVAGAGTVQNFRVFYEVPITYGDFDLRGAIFANIVNATMNLAFTFTNTFCAATATDVTPAVYLSASANVGALSLLTYTVYQNFLDQIPVDPRSGTYILPALDMATAYLLNYTSVTPLVNAVDNPISYSNFRNFMSTYVVLRDGVAPWVGTAAFVNYWALQAANYTNIFKVGPHVVKLWEREMIGDDFPLGTWYFSHRLKPISTVQYGNMQLIINPVGLNAAAVAFVGWESLAIVSQITNAGSLYGV
jgi:hypothetical protein